ncbi:DeoR/GlpR family DNA-binding transcription regulator [Radicibacter daui]|uniref:DeoR/GlpR family DNA-binding transcription regulator n=1 Tax=Radicibacter daui TaxID=3064829 RepID=UPI004046EF8D
MPSLQATLRHELILDLLQQHGTVKVGQLSEHLGVSPVTIRADLEFLEKQKSLRRTRGGAIPLRPRRYELPLEVTSTKMIEEKKAIARAAAAMVRDGDTVIIDTGGTTTETAKSLPHSLRDVVVFTNALNIAMALEHHPGVSVVVTGGTLRPLQHSLVAPFGTLMLREINADIAFIGVSGVDPQRGLTNTNLEEAEIKRVIIEAATRKVFLADHSKLFQVGTAKVASLAEADLLITDSGARQEQVDELAAAGLEVHVAHV